MKPKRQGRGTHVLSRMGVVATQKHGSIEFLAEETADVNLKKDYDELSNGRQFTGKVQSSLSEGDLDRVYIDIVGIIVSNGGSIDEEADHIEKYSCEISKILYFNIDPGRRQLLLEILEDDGRVVEHTLSSESYLEMYEYIGKAIRLREQIKEQRTAFAHQRGRSASSAKKLHTATPPSSKKGGLLRSSSVVGRLNRVGVSKEGSNNEEAKLATSEENKKGGIVKKLRPRTKSESILHGKSDPEPANSKGNAANNIDSGSNNSTDADASNKKADKSKIGKAASAWSFWLKKPEDSSSSSNDLGASLGSIRGDQSPRENLISLVSSLMFGGKSKRTSETNINHPETSESAVTKVRSLPLLVAPEVAPEITESSNAEQEPESDRFNKSPALSVEGDSSQDYFKLARRGTIDSVSSHTGDLRKWKKEANNMMTLSRGLSVQPTGVTRSPSIVGKRFAKSGSNNAETSGQSATASSNQKQGYNDSNQSSNIIKHHDGDDIVIWNKRGSTFEISAGTMRGLIKVLVKGTPKTVTGFDDSTFVDSFLVTYRHIQTPVQLMTSLCDLFENELQSDKIGNDPTMENIVRFVKRWVGDHSYEFVEQETDLMQKLNKFLDLVSTTSQKTIGNQIKAMVARIVTAPLQQSAEASPVRVTFPNLLPVAKTYDIEDLQSLVLGVDFLNLSARKVAQQLTVVESKLFRAIIPDEFALFLWGGCREVEQQKYEKIRNLQEYIARFNIVGYWVGTVVLSFDSLRQRTETLEKVIKIAKHCLDMQNFNTAMAIYSGLNTAPVSRLKKTFAGLSSKASAQYEELESKLLYEGNYKVTTVINLCKIGISSENLVQAYRELLACAEPPYLPFFGLLIKDLTFMNDGNQKMVNDLVNVSKLRQIYDVILKVRNNQRHRFPYAADETPLRAAGVSAAAQLFVTLSPYSGGIPVSLFYYCSNPPALKEDQLLAISKALESQVADTGTSTLGRARGLTGLGGVPSKAKNTMLALCETRGWTTGRRGSSQSTESQESQLRRSESSSVVSYYSALDTSDGINCQSKALGNG